MKLTAFSTLTCTIGSPSYNIRWISTCHDSVPDSTHYTSIFIQQFIATVFAVQISNSAYRRFWSFILGLGIPNSSQSSKIKFHTTVVYEIVGPREPKLTMCKWWHLFLKSHELFENIILFYLQSVIVPLEHHSIIFKIL